MSISQEFLRLFNRLDQILAEDQRESSEGPSIPNLQHITNLVNLVQEHPDLWVMTVDKINSKTSLVDVWSRASEHVKQEMQSPHREYLVKWLSELLKPAYAMLNTSSVTNAYDALEAACQALIVYDRVTPPRNDETSEKLIGMEIKDVAHRATHSPQRKNSKGEFSGNFPEAAPLILPVVMFLHKVKQGDGDDKAVTRHQGDYSAYDKAVQTGDRFSDYKVSGTPQSTSIRLDSGKFTLDPDSGRFSQTR